MATFRVYTSFDMSHPIGMPADAFSGLLSARTPTSFISTYNTWDVPDIRWATTFTGTFTYDASNSPNGGTITGVSGSVGSQQLYSLTGSSVDLLADGALAVGVGATELVMWLAAGSTIYGSTSRDSLVPTAANETFWGGGGTDRVVFSGAQASYTISVSGTVYTVTDNAGSGGSYTLHDITYLKFSGGYYQSAPAAAVTTGTSANETLTGGFGNDTISGGGGVDTIALSGPLVNYVIAPTSTGYTITDSTGFDGNYSVAGFSYMKFFDQTLSFIGKTVNGTSGNDTIYATSSDPAGPGHGNDTITGGGGVDTYVLTGPQGNYVVTGDAQSGYVVKDTVGLDGTDTLFGIAKLQFTNGAQSVGLALNGTTGNDTLLSGPGNDSITGGGGSDTVVFTGASSNYTITRNSSTNFTVTDKTGADGTDTLINIASLQFTDQTLTTASFTAQTINGTSAAETLSGGHGNDTISGGGGYDMVTFSGPYANYTVTGSASSGYVVKDNVGFDGTKTLQQISYLQFTDQTVAKTSNLVLSGTAGNDTIVSGPGNDAIDGGAGTNTVAFSGNRLNYSVVQTPTGYIVTNNTGTDGTDTLTHIQELRFADGMQNLSIAADAASITTAQLNSLTEIYVAYFNRVPEASGLDYWIGQFKGGMSLNDIGSSFYVAALTYSSSTGYTDTMTNTDFITKVYQNVLGRTVAADDPGVNYWLAGLADGTQTRGSLVNTILVAAHTYKGDPVYGPVADLLDNKLAVGKYNAVTAGVDYLTSNDAITHGMAVAAAVTATDTATAVGLIGLATQVPFTG